MDSCDVAIRDVLVNSSSVNDMVVISLAATVLALTADVSLLFGLIACVLGVQLTFTLVASEVALSFASEEMPQVCHDNISTR